MKKQFYAFLIALTMVCFGAQIVTAQTVRLQVHYLENYPFAYQDENGQLTGLEIDVLMAFADWMMRTKDTRLDLEFNSYADFAKLYEKIKNSDSDEHLGLASATITRERQKEVAFTPPYLKNVSLLVSNIDVPTLRTYSDMPEYFKDMTALVLRGTVLENQLLDIKRKHFEKMRVNYVQQPVDVVRQIAETDKRYFGYVDILTYWALLKEGPANVKIHRIATLDQQRFGLLLPLNSSFKALWNEFMEGGFGFAATETYFNLLRKHLGYEVIETVSIH
jgi:membrane-bound lytic murein transglycosylase MltF